MAHAGTLAIRGLNKQYEVKGEALPVLQDINLTIEPGEFVSIVGSSGCGKSTLLRLVIGLEGDYQGEILLNGQRIVGTSLNRGIVFQEHRLFPWLTVEKNVALGLLNSSLTEGQQRATVREHIALVGLQGFETAYPHQLSGGMSQRVAIARALVNRPDILLLDEPFGALDAKVRKELRRWLRRLHDELHVTSIFVTHDQEEALEVADRVVVINQGKIEQSGSPQQVWDQPASPFVYGFLGDVNLFHGRAHEGLVHLEGMQIDSPEHQTAQNAKAFAYVRPHDLDVERYSPGAGLDAEGRPRGIVAQLSRAIVVGPIARLELIPTDDHKPADNASPESLIEAQIPAQQFKEMGFKEGETLVVTPRRARVFLDHAAGI